MMNCYLLCSESKIMCRPNSWNKCFEPYLPLTVLEAKTDEK